MKQCKTIDDYLSIIETNYCNPKAVSDFINNQWISLSSQEFTQQVRYLTLALHKIGIKKGDTVGIVSAPSSRWVIADLAILAAGGVSVPLFANISDENFQYIVAQTSLKTVFVAGQELWVKYRHHEKSFQNVIGMDAIGETVGALSWEHMQQIGRELDKAQPALYQQLRSANKPEDTSTVIYTSGTTGVPKGAEHTHYSLFSMIHTDLFHFDWKADSYLSVLPLAHVYARVLNYIISYWGVSIYYFNDLKNVGVAAREIRPTLMVVVPRLLEKVYSKMLSGVHSAPALRRWIGEWAFDLARREKTNALLRAEHKIADKLVYHKLREGLGGRVRMMLSGGAALDPHLNQFYLNVGIPIYEGYGMTEGCPITVNFPGHVKVGTVGLPIGPDEVKISESGELLVRGPNVMKGYFKNKEATAQALDSQGYYHTGDKGIIDTDGYVKLTGRFKELFKTSTGEMVIPIPIEQAICKAPFIDLALVIADKRKFASALLVPDMEMLKILKRKQNVQEMSDEEFLKSSYMLAETKRVLDQVNSHLNRWEQVRSYRFIPHALTIENGELTPSMKIVRQVVENRYKELVDSIYEEEPL